MRLTDFHLLLLEDDPTQLDPMKVAARDAGLDGSLHVVHDREEAVEYFFQLLQPRSPLRAHGKHFIFLFNLEGVSSLSVLGWLREQPRLRHMVKVGIYSAPDGAAADRGYALGVNSCLLRPASREGLVLMFESIRRYWMALNQPPQL